MVIGSPETGGADTFVFDTATDFGDDTVFDAGAGGTEDTALFENVGGGGTLADLDAISTTVDDGTDVTVTVIGGGSVTFIGIGVAPGAAGLDDIFELDATAEIEVFTTP